MKENLHRDYLPFKVKECVKSSIVSGVILKLCFIKVDNMSLLERIRYILLMPKYKDVYFWLPYKRVVDASSKYGITGPSSRYPYANQWFEVKHDSEIYEQGLNEFVFHREKLYKAKNELRLTEPFLASELLTLTRKVTIKVLDTHVFKTTKRRQPKKVSSKSKI